VEGNTQLIQSQGLGDQEQQLKGDLSQGPVVRNVQEIGLG